MQWDAVCERGSNAKETRNHGDGEDGVTGSPGPLEGEDEEVEQADGYFGEAEREDIEEE